MATIQINLTCELQEAVKVRYLDGNLFSQDNQGNQINITVFDNGEPATLGGSVTANVLLSDGSTVPVTGGTITGNVVSITLPAAAYAVPGLASIIVKLTADSVITTIAALVANVYQSSTDTVIDPGTIIPSIQDLIDDIETAVASIPADYSSLWTSLAPAFSSSTSYVAGQYVTYNGSLYRFSTAHSGSWNSSDVTTVNIGGELSDLKSAINKGHDDSERFYIVTSDNLFDRNDCELGNFNSAGEEQASTTEMRTKTPIAIKGDYISTNVICRRIFYDASMTRKERSTNTGNAVAIPEWAAYVRFSLTKARYDETQEIMINVGEHPAETYKSFSLYVKFFDSTIPDLVDDVSDIQDTLDVIDGDNKNNMLTVNNDLEDATRARFYTWIPGQIRTNTTPVSTEPETSDTMTCCVVECAEGDKFKLIASGAKTTHRPWAFLDSSKNVITGYIAGQNSANEVLTAPTNAAYLVCNSAKANYHILKSGYIGADLKLTDRHMTIMEYSDYAPVDFSPSEFSVGSLSSVGKPSTASNRIRTNDFFPVNNSYVLDITITTGYKVWIVYYSTNDASGFLAWSGSSAYETSTSVSSFPAGTMYCKFVIADTNDSDNITVNDCDKVSVQYKKKVIMQLQSGEAYLPEYWTNYLDNKLPFLNNKDAELGRNGVSFAFVTDVHWEGHNAGWSPAILKYITENTNIMDVICGGDIIGLRQYTKAAAMNELEVWMRKTKGLHIVNILGNHDLNTQDTAQDPIPPEAYLSKDIFYALECRQSESFVTFAPGCLYGYSDNEDQKVRYIFLDSNAPLSTQLDPGYTDDKGHGPQMTWMKERIAELETGWTVIIFCHRFFQDNGEPEAKSSGHIINALQQLYSNYTVNAKIACVIVGHSHRNRTYSIQAATNVTIPVIASTCDSYNSPSADPAASDRSLGNTTEQCFDLYYINTDPQVQSISVVRIGAGDTTYDRDFTY